MKKIVIFSLMALLLVGCTNGNSKDDNRELVYDSFKSQLDAHTEFVSSSKFFDITAEKNKTGQTITLEISDFRIEMYNVQMIVYSSDIANTEKTWPEFNILSDAQQVDFIPGQSYPERGINDFLTLEFDSQSSEIMVLIKWQNRSNTETFEQFIKLNVNDPFHIEPEEVHEE